MEFHIESVGKAFRNLGQVITAASLATQSPFPFVTVPMFEVYGQQARNQSGIEIFAYTPLVSEEDRVRYELYTNMSQGWIEESRKVVFSNDNTLNASQYVEMPIIPMLWERDKYSVVQPTNLSAPYAPVWQVSPPPFSPGFINYNFFGQVAVATLFEVVKVVRGKLLLIVDHCEFRCKCRCMLIVYSFNSHTCDHAHL
jgi:hypothetical protein